MNSDSVHVLSVDLDHPVSFKTIDRAISKFNLNNNVVLHIYLKKSNLNL